MNWWLQLKRFKRDVSGNFYLMGSILMVPLIMAVGMAIDYGQVEHSRSRAQDAADATVLMAVQDPETNINKLNRKAQGWFAENFQDVGNLESYEVKLSQSGQIIRADVTGKRKAHFMQIFGYPNLSFQAEASSGRSTTNEYEIALVLDMSKSMWGDPITELRDASRNLVDHLFGLQTQLSGSAISVVPYRTSVNIGTQYSSWLNSTIDFSPGSWGGCVDMRKDGTELTDTPPNISPFKPYYWRSGYVDPGPAIIRKNNWPAITELSDFSYGDGPNVGCMHLPILPLTNDKAILNSHIDQIKETERSWRITGTLHTPGLVWGWRTLSPKWQNLWQSNTDYLSPSNGKQKLLIFMTDGRAEYPQQNRSAFGFASQARSYLGGSYKDVNLWNALSLEICDNIKSNGITIAGILYNETDQQARDFVKSCASPNAFYLAKLNDLSDVFEDIVGSHLNGGEVRLMK